MLTVAGLAIGLGLSAAASRFLNALLYGFRPDQDTASIGPPPGECVISRSSLSICRDGSTANSWLVTVGATASRGLPVTCDGGNNFCGVIVDRFGSSVKVYKTDNIQAGSSPTPLATIADGSQLANDALIIGARGDGTFQFQGWISVLAYYNRSLGDNELQHFVDALRKFEANTRCYTPASRIFDRLQSAEGRLNGTVPEVGTCAFSSVRPV